MHFQIAHEVYSSIVIASAIAALGIVTEGLWRSYAIRGRAKNQPVVRQEAEVMWRRLHRIPLPSLWEDQNPV